MGSEHCHAARQRSGAGDGGEIGGYGNQRAVASNGAGAPRTVVLVMCEMDSYCAQTQRRFWDVSLDVLIAQARHADTAVMRLAGVKAEDAESPYFIWRGGTCAICASRNGNIYRRDVEEAPSEIIQATSVPPSFSTSTRPVWALFCPPTLGSAALNSGDSTSFKTASSAVSLR